MEKWLIRNLKWFTLIFFALFIFKSTQSCNRRMSLKVMEKNLVTEHDSIIKVRDQEIKTLKNEIMTRDYMIKDLEKDLEIAGIRVSEADRRAEAVQKTAEKVRQNTTIQIRGVERDTVKSKK
jgi:L-lactate utilization protein LutB